VPQITTCNETRIPIANDVSGRRLSLRHVLASFFLMCGVMAAFPTPSAAASDFKCYPVVPGFRFCENSGNPGEVYVCEKDEAGTWHCEPASPKATPEGAGDLESDLNNPDPAERPENELLGCWVGEDGRDPRDALECSGLAP
jgi:hypothetical protein